MKYNTPSQCPRCGRMGMAEGHTLMSDWRDCLDAHTIPDRLPDDITLELVAENG